MSELKCISYFINSDNKFFMSPVLDVEDFGDDYKVILNFQEQSIPFIFEKGLMGGERLRVLGYNPKQDNWQITEEDALDCFYFIFGSSEDISLFGSGFKDGFVFGFMFNQERVDNK